MNVWNLSSLLIGHFGCKKQSDWLRPITWPLDLLTELGGSQEGYIGGVVYPFSFWCCTSQILCIIWNIYSILKLLKNTSKLNKTSLFYFDTVKIVTSPPSILLGGCKAGARQVGTSKCWIGVDQIPPFYATIGCCWSFLNPMSWRHEGVYMSS